GRRRRGRVGRPGGRGRRPVGGLRGGTAGRAPGGPAAGGAGRRARRVEEAREARARPVAVSEVVRAAGGVVWRAGERGAPEVLLVYRTEHDDWTFPTGKANLAHTHH